MASPVALQSAKMTIYPNYAEAESPGKRWSVTSNWTDELCKETKLFLSTVDCPPQMYGKPLGEKEAKVRIDLAKEKMAKKDPITTFAIRNMFDTVIGVCSLDHFPNHQIEISCRIRSEYQHQGIAKWILNLLIKDYLPAVGKQDIPLVARVEERHYPVFSLMRKFSFEYLGVSGNKGIYRLTNAGGESSPPDRLTS